MTEPSQQQGADSEVSISVAGTDVLVKATGTVEAEVDGERILLSPADFAYFGLAGTGANVWELIDGQRTLDDIVGILEDEFEAEDSEIRADVVSFVEALKSAGLVL